MLLPGVPVGNCRTAFCGILLVWTCSNLSPFEKSVKWQQLTTIHCRVLAFSRLEISCYYFCAKNGKFCTFLPVQTCSNMLPFEKTSFKSILFFGEVWIIKSIKWNHLTQPFKQLLWKYISQCERERERVIKLSDEEVMI